MDLWGHFLSLHATRTFGPNPPDGSIKANCLSYGEIDAYSRLFGIGLRPYEVDLINRIDRLFRQDRLHPVDLQPANPIKSAMLGLINRQKKGKA
jgi:hypothetical protein